MATWACIHRCDAHGEGPTSPKDAEKHLKETGHGVWFSDPPAEKGKAK